MTPDTIINVNDGTVLMILGKTPAGYIPCDGRICDIKQYPKLQF